MTAPQSFSTRSAPLQRRRTPTVAHDVAAGTPAPLADASDTMMAHPLAVQLRNLQTLVELGVDKNTTVVFPAPLMSTQATTPVGAPDQRTTRAAAVFCLEARMPTRKATARCGPHRVPRDPHRIIGLQNRSSTGSPPARRSALCVVRARPARRRRLGSLGQER
jgi:hypothetical protein